MERKLKTCCYCGRLFNQFETERYRECPECREIFSNMSTIHNGKNRKRRGEYEQPSLNENIAAAKAAGLSYWQYKALQNEVRVKI